MPCELPWNADHGAERCRANPSGAGGHDLRSGDGKPVHEQQDSLSQRGCAKSERFLSNYAPNLGGITNNERTLLTNTPSQTPNWYVVKLDHVLREQDHLSGSWIYDHKLRTLDDGGGVWQSGTTTGGPLSNARIQFYHQQEYRISESHTFSPNMLNVLNFTNAFDDNGSTPTDPGNYNSQVGFANTGADNFPEISFSDNQAGISETYIGNTWQGDVAGSISTTGDTLTWSKGRHTLSFGGDFVAHDINYRSGTGAYAFNFSYLNTVRSRLSIRWVCVCDL